MVGYDVAVGGGMGMTHGEPETFPRTADVMGFCRPEQAVDVAEKVVLVQRDYGDRSNRKHARLKYAIEDRGIDWFRAEVERRLGYALEAPRPFAFEHTGDRYGWVQDHEGNWHYTLFVQNGRCWTAGGRLRTGLAEIARAPGRLPPHREPEPDDRPRATAPEAPDRAARAVPGSTTTTAGCV